MTKEEFIAAIEKMREYKDYTGRKFGRLEAKEFAYRKNGRTYWKFACECGNEIINEISTVVQGNKKSCGCIAKERHQKFKDNVIGQRYGKLVIENFSYRKNGMSYYKCKCDCGKSKNIALHTLRQGSVKSCGCLKNEISTKLPLEKKELSRVDGTFPCALTQKTRVDSKTGVKGVCFTKSGKFRAHITLKGRFYDLGVYDTLEDAKKARLSAEEKLFRPILEKQKEKEK